MKNIRNFSIIAHIDHGKSTLADRLLEITHTIEKRAMRDQVLDSMDLERERGITIKMQPVRMVYRPQFPISNSQFSINKPIFNENSNIENLSSEFILNLIDTPGHIDFSYEVSRALRAVEGSILLVDATQGVQAQTLTTLGMAQSAGLKILPVISKIDSPLARIDETSEEIEKLLGVSKEEILQVSGKTGAGVEALLEAVIERVPPPIDAGGTPKAAEEILRNSALIPRVSANAFQALIFDFKYSSHKGVIVFVRVFSGEVKKGDKLSFKIAGKSFQALEVGIFAPEEKATEGLKAGEIGYIVTGIKEPGIASVGDTVVELSQETVTPALPGYEVARPVVWASVYPENQDHFNNLKLALSRLRLSDSAFSFEEESSGVLGRGFRCGFLGMLHLEIITERLRREFDLPLVITLPSITYEVTYKTGKKDTIYTPSFFPEDHLVSEVREPWVDATIIIPPEYMSALIQLLYEFEAELGETETFSFGAGHKSGGSGRTSLKFQMPLRELMRGFFDKLKAVTSGFGSISYVLAGERLADVTRLDILVADEPVLAFAKVISRRQVEEEAERAVEKLSKILPRQMFTTKIQAKALGRIIASHTLSGMRKDVTQHMYGGDITRKMKLREKQKKGKKKMKERGKVSIPQEVFLKMIKRD